MSNYRVGDTIPVPEEDRSDLNPDKDCRKRPDKTAREAPTSTRYGNIWEYGAWLVFFTATYLFVAEFHGLVALMVEEDWGSVNLFDVPWLMDNRSFSVCAFYFMDLFTKTPNGLCLAIIINFLIFGAQSRLSNKNASIFLANCGGALLILSMAAVFSEGLLLIGPLLNKR